MPRDPEKLKAYRASDAYKARNAARVAAKKYAVIEENRRVCEACGEVFYRAAGTRDAARACSRKCGFVLIRRDQQQIQRERMIAESAFSPVCFIECGHCAKPFRKTPNQAIKFCSKDCAYAVAKAKWTVAKGECHLECEECGRGFVQKTGFRGAGKHRLYCSARCMNRITRRKRKIAERLGSQIVERVSFKQIWDRTGGRCHICGELCSLRFKSPHPLTPTLDHMLPISKGGEHRAENLAIAHMVCNSFKGSRLNTELYQAHCRAAVEVAKHGGDPWTLYPRYDFPLPGVVLLYNFSD